MAEMKSPFSCPKTVTVRRNPHRRARPTPSSTVPLPLPLSSPQVPPDIPSFPIEDILSAELPETQRPSKLDSSSSSQNPKNNGSENLKVFLRISPLAISKCAQKQGKQGCDDAKNAWPKNPKAKNLPKKKVKKNEICVKVNDSHSVTVSLPNSLQESKRVKSEVYEGFSNVFSDESSQAEVYEKLVHPLVEDFLRGKSGMLAALGPTGSGKTHTVFGCIREPGMVPLALRHIFSQDESNGNQVSRTFYLSMFEICSEKGKSERIFDLLREGEGGEVSIQQSAIKGLNEVTIRHAQQAESLIAHGMLSRATAATNSNSQSSRSQCIINICCIPSKIDEEFDNESKSASLTIVDLAGAEREKKTGNQGLRMLESNFINNTSMVFGLCLRSLLEHQKNPKRPLQKHFQNSLLTRYLREYLEGKKRMALVLTLKPGEEDYLETSNLLKQAAPYAQIKITSIEEPGKSKCSKRPIQVLSRAEHLKRMKFSSVEAYSINEATVQGDQPQLKEKKDESGNLKDVLVENEEFVSCKVNEGIYIKGGHIELAKRDREHQIMVYFAKALWDVLKQYKQKLEMAEHEICCLRDNLSCEKQRSSDLEKEVKDLRVRSSFLEVNSSCLVASCTGIDSFEEQHNQHEDQKDEKSCTHISTAENLRDSKHLQAVDMHPENGATAVWIVCSGQHLQDLKDNEEEHSSVSNASNIMDMTNVQRDDRQKENEGTGLINSSSCLVASSTETDSFQEQHNQHDDQKDEKSCTHISTAENLWNSKHLQAVDMHPENGATAVWIASQDCASERCEEAAETACSGQHLQDLKDNEEEHSRVNNARNLMDTKNVQRDDRQVENEGTGLINNSSCMVASSAGIDSFQEQHNQHDDQKDKKSCTHISTVENLRYSKHLQAVDMHPENGVTAVWIVSQDCASERCEEAAETACSGQHLQDLKDNEEEHSSVSNASNIMDMTNVQRDDRQKENEGTGLINNSSFMVASSTGIDSFQEQHNQHADLKDEKSCTHISTAENLRDSKHMQAVDMHPENGATAVWIASQDCASERCEEAAETAWSGQHLQDLKDNEEEHSCVNNASNLMDTKNVQRDDRQTENEGTDDLESATSCLQSCVKTTEVCIRSLEETAISASVMSDSVVRSSFPPVLTSGYNSSAVETDQLSHKERELDQSVTVIPRENASLTQDTQDCTVPDTCLLATCNSRKTEKPKRRLLPASSTLLKDIGSLAVEDDIDKPKGARGEKRVTVETRNKSKGSISLLRLLRNDLHL